ncbi:MAG: amidohydrolase [Actinomycetia bacterium]|nr:amidohydrolase [Actinomycetes bacterium]
MKTGNSFVLLVLGAVVAVACTSGETDGRSDGLTGSEWSGVIAIVNAEVYTLDPDEPWAEAFAFDEQGVIVAVGSEVEVLDLAGDEATVVDIGGNLVLPGFQDAHVHVPEAGINLEVCFLPGGLSIDDYEDLAVECAEEQQGSGWVRAVGASLFDLGDTDESPLTVLDRAIPGRPAIVLDDLGHAVWTNSLGLEAAGIGPDDLDPQGGVFHRDPSGNLTGLLLEDAQQLVRNAAAPDDETNYRGLLVAMEELAANGITAVSDAGGFWGQNHPAAWQRAQAEGTLTVRAANSLYLYPDLPMDTQLAEFEQRFANESEMLRFDTAKIYLDGILDLGTASLLRPYDTPVDIDHPSGFSYFQADQLITYVNELHTIGYRINFHAIGDKAVRDALDAVEAIDDDPEAIADRRHRTTHNYLVDPTDLPRFTDLGIIADLQHSEDAVATDYHEFLSEFIGDRAFDLIPTAQLIDAEATVIMSSDWDAGPLPPLGTIERALTRDANAVLDLETAIAMHTIDAAYALGHDDITGSIEMGKLADFVVLDQHILEIKVEQIGDTSVLMTVVGGRNVYQAPGFSP